MTQDCLFLVRRSTAFWGGALGFVDQLSCSPHDPDCLARAYTELPQHSRMPRICLKLGPKRVVTVSDMEVRRECRSLLLDHLPVGVRATPRLGLSVPRGPKSPGLGIVVKTKGLIRVTHAE